MKRWAVVPFIVGCVAAISAVSGQGAAVNSQGVSDVNKMSTMRMEDQSLVNRLDVKDKQIFEQFTADQKLLVNKIVNEFKVRTDNQKVSEQQILDRLDAKDKAVFQKFNSEQKALVVKLINESKTNVDKSVELK